MPATESKFNKNGDTDRIRKALDELGDMTATELCEQLGLERKSFHQLMRRLRLNGEAYIKKYVESDTNTRTTPVAMYSLGVGTDAAKPKKQKQIEVRRRYEEKRKLRNRTNSVFSLAKPRHAYRLGVRT